MRTESLGAGTVFRHYAIDPTESVNYRQELQGGIVTSLRFGAGGDSEPVDVVDWRVPQADWPHFIIVLDGIPFDLVVSMYGEGHFRLFPPPTPVVSVFPALTDVALSRLFHTPRCQGSEAMYFNRTLNRLSAGNDVYVHGDNASWTRAVDYCAPQNVAVDVYLKPWTVFSRELRAMHRLFSATDAATAIAYSVGTAGIGTRGGEEGLRACLREVEKLCERITYDRRGRVRWSILADHGHSLQSCERVSFRTTLEAAGFRVTGSLESASDVAIVSYGLVSVAAMYTDRAADVAAVLAEHPAVDLVLYRVDERVIVRKGPAVAEVRRGSSGFIYDPIRGDPLELNPTIEVLRAGDQVASNGCIADQALLSATAQHKYPDPLYRIWSCFDGQVIHCPDVVASLRPAACHGSKFFHFFVAPVASTHGSLDNQSSVTFLLTHRASALPRDVLRIGEVMDILRVDRLDETGGGGAIGAPATEPCCSAGP